MQYSRLISRDRPTKYLLYCIFLKYPFCFAALSFTPKGLGGVFNVDYSRYNKEYREFVYIHVLGWSVEFFFDRTEQGN